MTDTQTPKPRAVSEIAAEIGRTWGTPYFGAVPHLQAMREMGTVNDAYGADDGRGIVLRFLENARTWRGADARRIKAELKALLDAK